MNTQPNNAGAAGQEDYVDKALNSAERKFGGKYGANTARNRSINEKITDKLRGLFEKATGKRVPSKVSN